MQRPTMEFTAVYLKARHGYIGFVEELPGVHADGRTIAEARDNLVRLAETVFDEERRQTAELLAGKDVVREPFVLAVGPARRALPAAAAKQGGGARHRLT
jgi:predicted RNase H-like HicB family nuclease